MERIRHVVRERDVFQNSLDRLSSSENKRRSKYPYCSCSWSCLDPIEIKSRSKSKSASSRPGISRWRWITPLSRWFCVALANISLMSRWPLPRTFS